MVFTPDTPFPKQKGHVLKSKDWNDAIAELQRLDKDKVNKVGDNVTGQLTVAGNLGVGTSNPQDAQQIGTSIAFHNGGNKVIGFGWSPGQGRALEAGFPAEIRWAPTDGFLSLGIDSTSRSAGNAPAIPQTLTIRKDRVGIGHTSPPRSLQVGDDVGGIGFSPSDASPNAGYIRWGDNTGWRLHFGRSRESSGGALNTGTAGVLVTMRDNGNVGIGSTAPQSRLQIRSLTTIEEGATGAGAWANFGSNAFYDGIWKRVDTTKAGVNLHMNSEGAGQEFRFLRLEADGSNLRNIATIGSGTSFIAEGSVGIGTVSPGFKLDVADRIRLRQGGSGTAGLWLYQTGPAQDRAFVGMRQDNQVGLWGNTGAGWGLFMDTSNGDVTITGRLGTNGFAPTPRQTGWGGGIHTWDIEAEATIWSRNNLQTGPRDLAENFSSEMDLDAGDVVCMGHDEDSIIVSEGPNDGLVLGVISSEPGILLNVDRDVDEDRLFPVALCGRVPCKAVDENGPIERGDLLTTSSTAGHAMKASRVTADGQETFRAGTIIGKALSPLESGKGVIEVLVTSR